MANQSAANDRLDGWDAISGYLGWHTRTVIRWEKQKGLPVHRIPGGKRQPVYAYRHEIDQWFRTNGGISSEPAPASIIDEGKVAGEAVSFQVPGRRISRLTIHAIAAATILLVSAFAVALKLTLEPVIQITGVAQLTDDGVAKRNIVTDGKQLYFSEDAGGETKLFTMAASGGTIRQIAVPFPNPNPEDISTDGKFLLVLSYEGHEEEHPLWIVPIAHGQPAQIAGVKCGAAAWSPKGEWIAFGRGSAVYLISPDGARSRLLSGLSGIPLAIKWSPDEKRLLLLLGSSPADSVSLWKLDLDKSFNVERAGPIPLPGGKMLRGDSLAQGAESYFAVANESSIDRLMELRPLPWWRAQSIEAFALSTQFKTIEGLAADASARRLFVLSGARQRGELARYNPATQSFNMLLPGSSAVFVDFARKLDLVAYVNSQDLALWVSRNDGSEARKLSPAGIQAQLPRISPEGKRVAFMGKESNRPWRIFVVPVAGGVPREASESDDNQGAPTWSPDGRYLVYGNIDCQQEHTCSIHRIDLANGEISAIPGSQGLGTARWSPDGKHIAALNPVRYELQVFDLSRQHWRKLADGITGNDVSWSSDSRFVYTKSSMNGHPAILRVPVGGGAAQVVLNLDSFGKTAGQLDTWFSLTPDNALILSRFLNNSEVYELDYKEQ